MIKRVLPKPFQYFGNVRFFLFSLCLIIALFVAGVFFVLYNRTNALLTQRIHEQAVSYENLIRHTKNWNYNYGGVYVEKRPGVESSAYMLKLGMNPDVRTESGTVLTIRNHAIMVDEISQQIKRHEGVFFRVISRKPLSERNKPDITEQNALESFEKGAREFSRTELAGGHGAFYRYLVPLQVEPDCLNCHSAQGYKAGDIIGAISISIPISKLMSEINANRLLISISAILTIGILVGITYFLTWRLVIQLDAAQKSLKKLASTDELTGIKNRRQIMKRLDEEFSRASRLGEPLCIIIMDIDHFKKINDTYGHPCGDRVLKQVASLITENLRNYDRIGRIGGEEFLLVSPGSSIDDARTLAERLRQTINNEQFGEGGCRFSITISAGVTALAQADDNVDILIKRADEALYEAKQSGRNRVVIS
ncbi:response regulator PleD [Geobacter sp. OR-1]|uniref:diguanylate cyclase n=1 Tax=Geobacter sp. OR-1 TaxID=1266765 RepID=UPI0005428957|nr:diguanylate cyclase [Geobacter sp. OR-1]GAM09503.1 response regulator PleD [Geobacter sp. OR-1]